MTYDNARQYVSAYADGELSPRLAREFQAAMAEYPALRHEVEQCRALRRCLNRVLFQGTVPPHLESRIRERVRAAASTRRRRRLLLWPVVGLAAAVALLLVLQPGPRGSADSGGAGDPAAVKLVRSVDFAVFHLRCACRDRHNPIERSGFSCAAEAQRAIGQSRPFARIPDLARNGYELDGVCECFNHADIHVVHAYYRFPGHRPEVLSIFSLDRPVKLADGQPVDDPIAHRTYEIGNADDVTVLKWNGADGSFAVCGRADAQTIRSLADTINIAWRAIGDDTAFASAVRP